MSEETKIGRRDMLARLGLTATAIYAVPSITSFGMALAGDDSEESADSSDSADSPDSGESTESTDSSISEASDDGDGGCSAKVTGANVSGCE